MEKVDVSEMAELLADPHKWIDAQQSGCWDDYHEDFKTLFRLAQFLVKEEDQEKKKAYESWCNIHNLNNNSNEVRYIYDELLLAVATVREAADDAHAEVLELRKEIEHLRRMLNAVEITQQRQNERLNMVVP